MATSLREALQAHSTLTSKKCDTGRAIDQLQGDDRKALIEGLADPLVAHVTIVDVLKEYEPRLVRPPAKSSVMRHRRGECKCQTD